MAESTSSFTIDDYFNLLARSGLLEEKLFDAQKKRYESENASPKVILNRMVSENLLTQFQAKQLSERRHRGFFLSEKYKILDFLGQGGMSRVLLCEHMLLQRLVAVKILNKSLDKFPGAAERFLREARASASMDHPNIARIFDVDRTGLGPCIVMEYVDGTNLHELTVKRDALDVNRVANFIRQAAIALQQAHQAGLVHRDIKPANLMLERTGIIKLLDLGLARFFDPSRSDNLTQQIDASCIIGTADYISPEQVMESSSADIRADIYSLGYTMYFLLTRVLPAGDGPVMRKLVWHQTSDPEPVRNLRPEVPAELAAVLERMIKKKPDERYQSPAEVVAALEPWAKAPSSPPIDAEMPKTKAIDYRLGLCSPPDSSKFAGAPSSSSATKSSVQPGPSRGSSVVRQEGTAAAAPDSQASGGSVIGYTNPLGSEAIMPTGSTIRSAKTNEVMSASTETVATSASSYMRGLAEAIKGKKAVARRIMLPFLVILLAFTIGSWATLLMQLQTGNKNQDTDRNFDSVRNRNPSQRLGGPQKVPTTDSEKTSPPVATTGTVLRGGGSTVIRPVMEYWGSVYESQTGVKIEYSPVGSTKGVEGLIDRFLDFACTDAYLSNEQVAKYGSGIVHVPLTIAAVVPTYNLSNEPGEPVSIHFTGAVLANIYLGKIRKWNDPGIAVSNPGLELPDLEIKVIYRKDGSGTTAVWTEYLSKSSSAWKQQVGSGSSVSWPAGEGVEKNDGVADAVSRTVGAIGYVELNYALANSLSVGLVKNQSGAFIEPSIESITAAAATLRDVPVDLRYSLIDAPGEGSYPIIETCWAILRTDRAGERGPDLIRFLRWATTEGQSHATNLQYGRLPDEFSTRITEILDKAANAK